MSSGDIESLKEEIRRLTKERDAARRECLEFRETGCLEAEQALHRSETGFRQVAEALPQIVWVARPDGYNEYFNGRWYEFTGTTPEESRGDLWTRVLHPDDYRRTMERWRRSTETGEPYEIEYRFRRGSDGAYRWFLVRGLPLRDETGGILRWFGTCTDIHDLKEAQAAQRESEERFRTLADNISQLAWMADETGSIFWYNRRWFEFTGTTPEEMKGEGWRKVHHPDHLERAVTKFRRCIEAGEAWEDTFPLRGRDGEYRWFLSRAIPIRDERGRVTRWFGTNTDITELRRTQEALRESEERYRALFANMTEGFILGEPILDDAGNLRDVRFIEVNNAFERETGLPREVVGKPFTEALPHLEPSWIDYYGGVALTGEPIHFENYNKDTDRHYDVFCYSPSPGRFAAVFRDVTAIKKLAREKERTLAMLEAMLTYAPAGFAFFDREHRFVRVNEFLCRINGLPAEAHLGRPIREVLPENARSVDPLLDTLFETGRPMENIEVTGETPLHPGEVRHWLTGWYPVPLPQDQEPLVGAVVMEITGQKRMEQSLREAQEKLREANELLERRVAERTAELERANRELDAFNYSISHDLRAPLRSIDGFSQALLEDYPDRLDETGRDYLNRVRAAAQRMAALIDDQLRLSRIGRAELRKVPVDLSALAREVAEELRLREPERKVEWVIPPGLRARGDRALLKIALDNLLGNAWKFTARTPGARIEIGRQEGEEPVFFVRDNGAGFDMAWADRLFAPYQRLHAQQEFAGTGIGTTLVQRIVQRHGGRVWAEGTVGGGATFWFTLPVGAKNAEAGTPI